MKFFLHFLALGRVVEVAIARAKKGSLKIDFTPKTYRIYSNKRRGAYQIFGASSAALNRGRRLLKNWKLQEIFSFNSTVYLPSVRKITFSNRNVFSLSPFTSFGTFQWCLPQLRSHSPFSNNPQQPFFFFKKRHFQCGFRLSL